MFGWPFYLFVPISGLWWTQSDCPHHLFSTDKDDFDLFTLPFFPCPFPEPAGRWEEPSVPPPRCCTVRHSCWWSSLVTGIAVVLRHTAPVLFLTSFLSDTAWWLQPSLEGGYDDERLSSSTIFDDSFSPSLFFHQPSCANEPFPAAMADEHEGSCDARDGMNDSTRYAWRTGMGDDRRSLGARSRRRRNVTAWVEKIEDLEMMDHLGEINNYQWEASMGQIRVDRSGVRAGRFCGERPGWFWGSSGMEKQWSGQPFSTPNPQNPLQSAAWDRDRGSCGWNHPSRENPIGRSPPCFSVRVVGQSGRS